jgi:uncharacterized membrane protein
MLMEPAIVVTLLWMVFGGTHIALATGRVRAALVARLGEGGFTAFFSVVASVSFAVLIGYYASHRLEGAAGLALGYASALRWPLMAVIAAGVAFITAGLAVYPRLPMALFEQPISAPRGIERITRHPFFMGVVLIAVAHVLLATRLVGTVLAGGFAVLALAGARHQDAKLLRRRGQPYSDYVAATSTVPFGAVVSGRQRLAWRELPIGTLAAGLAVALALRIVHAGIFGHGGAWVIGTVVGGGAIATWQTWRRARRIGALPLSSPVQSYLR